MKETILLAVMSLLILFGPPLLLSVWVGGTIMFLISMAWGALAMYPIMSWWME